MAIPVDIVQRVAKRELASTAPSGECVVSTRHLNEDGYRESKFNGFYVGMAHRIVYMAAGHVIPDGMTIDHTCLTRSCLNVAHMEVVTLRENIDRALRRRHQEIAERGCSNGHPWTTASTYLYRGTRYCRTCNRAAQQAAREARRGASA